jgi:hypothetical protein
MASVRPLDEGHLSALAVAQMHSQKRCFRASEFRREGATDATSGSPSASRSAAACGSIRQLFVVAVFQTL